MYHFTVYDHAGNIIHDDALPATNDAEAKEKALAWLSENHHSDKPHRVFHTTGRLISFKPHVFDNHLLKATRE